MVSTILLPDSAAGYASIIAVFLPSVLVTAYVWGQFPTLFGLVTTLFTVHFLHNYLKNGNTLDLVLAICLLGASVSIHHFTAIFFLPPLIVVIVATSLLQRELDIISGVKRFLQFIAVGMVLSAVVLYPFITYTINNPMRPIPHITRTNFLADSFAFEVFFLRMYGPTLLLFPLIGLFVRQHKKLIPLLSLSILLFVLGLGGTTALPSIVFGSVWELLTYDRFALWAGVTLLPLAGLFLAHHYNTLRREKTRKIVWSSFFISLALLAAYSGSGTSLQSPLVNLEPIQEFLGRDENWRWRYLTLGFGDAKMQELSLLTNATTIDGYYAFARKTWILANSSIGTLDSAKFYGEQGLNVLEAILDNAREFNLKWVICNDPFYYEVLVQNSFSLQFSQDIAGDARFHGVTIWVKDGIPQIDLEPSNNGDTKHTTPSEYVWGIAPLSLLMASLVLLALRFFFKRSNHRSYLDSCSRENNRVMKGLEKRGIRQLWNEAYRERDEEGDRKLVWNRLRYLLWGKMCGLANSQSVVLEAGCGVSVLMNTFASKGADAIGLDISPIALRKAHSLFKKPLLVEGDICHLPFKDCSFDLVYNIGVIEHFKNPKSVLREMHRVSKVPSTIIVSVPNKFTLWTIGRLFKNFLNRLHLLEPWKYGYEKSYTHSDLQNLFLSAGLGKPKVSGCGTFEGFYITAYFFLSRPRAIIQLLYPLLSSKTASLRGIMQRLFAEAIEKRDMFGLVLLACSHRVAETAKACEARSLCHS